MGADYSLQMDNGPSWATYKSKTKKFTFEVERKTDFIGQYHQVYMDWNAEFENYAGGFFGTIKNDINEFYQSYIVDVYIIDMVPEIDLEVNKVSPIKET